MKNYGFPYKGSKNRLAEKIVKLFPDAENFYDLFCGGCAITHRALIENRWKNYVINDIDSRCPKLFLDAINGKFKNETRWISREDFFKLKDNDGYVAFCWSFGNNGRSYLYSKEKEPYKKALHYAIVFKDYSLGKELGFDFSVVDTIQGVHERKLFLQQYLKNNNIGKDSPLKVSIETCNILQHLNRLQSLQSLQSLQRLSISQKSYDEVRILPDSVIYCDIPYRGTDEYISGQFDYEKFYAWCEKQKELVVISEYDMPEDRFCCVESVQKRSLLSAKGAGELKTEKLFVPKHQIEMWLRLKGKYFNSFENQ